MNELQGASLFFAAPALVATSLPSVTREKKLKIPIASVPKVEIPEKTLENRETGDGDTSHHEVELRNEITNEQSNERSKEQDYGQSTRERTNERLQKRRRIRHTFDIFADQLLSLREITLEEEKYTGERVLLGELAQQALDMFITKYRNK